MAVTATAFCYSLMLKKPLETCSLSCYAFVSTMLLCMYVCVWYASLKYYFSMCLLCVYAFNIILTLIIYRLESDGRSFSVTLQCSTSQLPVNY